MAQLTFTAAQKAAQQAYSTFHLTTVETARYAPLAEYYTLVEQGRTREAADWADRFEAEALGYTQYADRFAGQVMLLRMSRRVRTKGGPQFQAGELAIGRLVPADEYLPEGISAWSPRTGYNVRLPQRSYQIVETVPARQG